MVVRRAIAWVRLVLGSSVLLFMALTCFAAQPFSQSQEDRLRDNERKIAVLESRLDGIEWLGRLLVSLVGGQLVLTGADFFRQRSRSVGDRRSADGPSIHIP